MSGKMNMVKSAGGASVNVSGVEQVKSGQNNGVGPAAGSALGMTSNPAPAANGASSSAAPSNSSVGASKPFAKKKTQPASVFNKTASAAQSDKQKAQRQQERKEEVAKEAESEKARVNGPGNAGPSNQAKVGALDTLVGTTKGPAAQSPANGSAAMASKQTVGTTSANVSPKVVVASASASNTQASNARTAAVGQSASSTGMGSSGVAAGNSNGSSGDQNKRKRSADDDDGRQSTSTAATASAQQTGTAASSTSLPGISSQSSLGTAPSQTVPVVIQSKRIKLSDETHYWAFENRVAWNPETGATVQFTREVEMTSEEVEFDADGDVKMSNAPEGTLQWTEAQLDEWRYVSGWYPAPPFHYLQTAVSWSSLGGEPSAVPWNGSYGSGVSG